MNILTCPIHLPKLPPNLPTLATPHIKATCSSVTAKFTIQKMGYGLSCQHSLGLALLNNS
jgi:hypothetical protein